ncbi:MAG: pyrimidine 5-nucleotidase [Deferribacteraceae bacterium]|jgi:putative hydrolase of the HAD superfamily|nr:pyrimidine 5-nucleotidase [Deferribacteraceae bacterium]
MLKNYIFDLDNTLYSPEKDVLKEIDRRINIFMHSKLNLKNVNELRKYYRDNYGTTLLGLMKHHGTNPRDYLDFVHDIEYEKLLDKDENLISVLGSIEGKKIIFTNGSYMHAVNTLTCLGVIDMFDNIFSIENYIEYPKPFEPSYDKVIKALQILPEESLYFEDSKRNLNAAKKFNFKTALVWDRDEDFDYSFDTIYDIIQLKDAEVNVG